MSSSLDTLISLKNFDTGSSLDVTLVLGDSISTKIEFDGGNVQEAVIDNSTANYGYVVRHVFSMMMWHELFLEILFTFRLSVAQLDTTFI